MKIYAGDRNFMKTPKKKTPIKDFLKKGTVKGIKFAGKTALSPLSLAFGAGAGKDLTGISGQVTEQVRSVANLLVIVAYVAGVGFALNINHVLLAGVSCTY